MEADRLQTGVSSRHTWMQVARRVEGKVAVREHSRFETERPLRGAGGSKRDSAGAWARPDTTVGLSRAARGQGQDGAHTPKGEDLGGWGTIVPGLPRGGGPTLSACPGRGPCTPELKGPEPGRAGPLGLGLGDPASCPL